MKRAIFVVVVVVGLALAIGGATAYVLATAGYELVGARAVFTGSPQDLEDGEFAAARAHLVSAQDKLRSPLARALRLVPVARQNLAAVDAVVTRALPAVTDARALQAELDDLAQGGIVEGGRVRLGALTSLGAMLDRQEDALTALEADIDAHQGALLLPPVADGLALLEDRVADLRPTVSKAAQAVRLAPGMLGQDGRRTYLVLLVNNAELRGGGGIVSGVGTLSVSRGRLSLGEFDYYAELAGAAGDRRVPSPPDFRRRFARYGADTTRWINTAASPDIPDVATVARRLYRVSAGIDTDGAVVIDPRGLAALLPPDETVEMPDIQDRLSAADIPQFVFSEAYARFADSQAARREALLALGPGVLDAVIAGGIDRDALPRLADAVAGQHLRVVSSHPSENEALAELNATGELATDADDSVFVTVQNLGADKLDFWMRRSVEHACAISDDNRARCSTTVTLRNRTPEGLPNYVVQTDKPYGLYRGYLELYVPGHVRATGFSLDGRTREVFPESEDGRVSLGTRFSTPPGERTTAVVSYDLDVEGAYSLEVRPQPLAHDARVDVAIRAPEGWTIIGPDDEREGELRHEGPLDRTLRFTAKPQEEERGLLSALWRGLLRFWREPLFSD